MRNILYFRTVFPKLSETFVSDQVRSLVLRGFHVTVFTEFSEGSLDSFVRSIGQESRERLNVVYVGRDPTMYRSAIFFARFIRSLFIRQFFATALRNAIWDRPSLKRMYIYAMELERGSYDRSSILICHFGPTGILGYMVRMLLKLECHQITVFHGNDVSGVLQRISKKYYSCLFHDPCHTSVAISNKWKNLLVSIGEPNAVHIPLGVSVEESFEGLHRWRKPEEFRVLTVGRLVEKKAHLDVIVALSKLLDDRCFVDRVRYSIVGDGPELNRILTAVDRLGLRQVVELHGALTHEEVISFMKKSDVFVLPSRTALDGDMEGIPIVLMEAMAHGVPVISTLHSGIPELIEPGVSGLLVAEGDTDALSSALYRLYEDPNYCFRLAERAFTTVSRDYNLEKNIDKFVELIEGSDGCAGFA